MEGPLLPSTKGCLPSWQEKKAESSGGAFQRVLHQGWLQRAAGAGRGQGARPDPTAPPCTPRLPWAGLQAVPAPPSQRISVLPSAGWGAVQNRQRAQLDITLLNTKGINNPVGEMRELFLAQNAKSTNCLLVRERFNFHRT